MRLGPARLRFLAGWRVCDADVRILAGRSETAWAGTLVLRAGGVYEAKWWSQGFAPDTPFAPPTTVRGSGSPALVAQ